MTQVTRTSEPRKLEGKVAIVTGAAGGLGKAIAKAFVEAGAKVALVDISDTVSAAEKELSALGTALAIQSDITKDGAPQAIVDETVEKLGKLDILINNAAISDHFEPVGDQDVELWDRLMSINLRAPMLLSKAFVNSLLKEETANGNIVNILSMAAQAGMVSGAAYTSSKHALLGLTKHTAAYYGKKGIRCNSLVPGGMATNIAASGMEKWHQQGLETAKTMWANIQLCDTEQIAKLAVFVVSEDANPLINGAVIHTDRGMAAFA